MAGNGAHPRSHQADDAIRFRPAPGGVDPGAAVPERIRKRPLRRAAEDRDGGGFDRGRRAAAGQVDPHAGRPIPPDPQHARVPVIGPARPVRRVQPGQRTAVGRDPEGGADQAEGLRARGFQRVVRDEVRVVPDRPDKGRHAHHVILVRGRPRRNRGQPVIIHPGRFAVAVRPPVAHARRGSVGRLPALAHHVGVVDKAAVGLLPVRRVPGGGIPLGIERAEPGGLITHPVHVGGLLGGNGGAVEPAGKAVVGFNIHEMLLDPAQEPGDVLRPGRVPLRVLQQVEGHVGRAGRAQVVRSVDAHVAVAVHPGPVPHRIGQQPGLERLPGLAIGGDPPLPVRDQSVEEPERAVPAGGIGRAACPCF